MGAVTSVLRPVAYMELSCQHWIWGHRGKRSGWVLAFAVRRGFFGDCQVLHIPLLWAVGTVNHQVSCVNDDDVKSADASYRFCHFRKFACSALCQLRSVQG